MTEPVMYTARAPGKIILFGEHAVVYGQPAIAVPFDTLQATAEATPAPPGSGLNILAEDVGLALRVHANTSDESHDNALVYAAQVALRALNTHPPDLTIRITSDIPIGGGFGSGAAVSAALIRVLAAALGHVPDAKTVNEWVYAVEKMHHGTPSGVDNTVIVYAQPVFFVRDAPLETFQTAAPLHFVVAYSGVGAPTRETVGDVRKLVESGGEYPNVIAEIGKIVRQAREAIESGGGAERLGVLMNANHAHLRTLGVSSDRLERLVTAARAAGAYGAKLSGGGRGGNIIALVRPGTEKDVSAALRTAGATKTWPLKL